jgi:hypothetical protein
MLKENTMDLKVAIEALEGSGAEIAWCLLSEDAGTWLKVEKAIAALGSVARRTTIYEDDDGREPYVIEAIEAKVQGVCIRAQWSRPATPAEFAQAQLHEDRKALATAFTATRLVG